MDTNDYSIGIWISILCRYRKSFVQKKLEGYGALGGFYLLVLTIYNHDGANQEQISGILKTDKAAVARGIKKLEKEGCVTRRPDSADKRAYNVYLTPKAAALVPEIRKAIAEWERLIVAGIPDETYQLIKQCMKQMAENASDITD